MANPYVDQAQNRFTMLVGSTDLNAGDLCYWDGSNVERADADVHTTFAEMIAVSDVKTGDIGLFCTSCILIDTDAPYTQGDNYFLAAPGGTPVAENFTRTRPTTAGNLRQVIGFALSTSELRMEVKAPYEMFATYNFESNQTDTANQIDTGNYVATVTNADGEDAGCTFGVPDNSVGIEIAYLYSMAEVVSGATDYTITVSGANDGEQWDATTEDATLTSLVVSGAVADEIQRGDVTTALDAAGIVEPDNVIGFHCEHDGAQTDFVAALSLDIVWLVV